MLNRPAIANVLVFFALVALAAGSRFAEIAPNFAAVGAAGLFAGFYFRSRVAAVGVPVVAMLVSDMFLGSYPWYQVIAVYGCLTLPVLLGRWMQRSHSVARVVGSSLAMSVVFFVVTNFSVWLSGFYGYGLVNLAECYVAALPFFKYTLAGDLVYAGVIFGAYEAARALTPRARCAIA
jgi:hypothetical protein